MKHPRRWLGNRLFGLLLIPILLSAASLHASVSDTDALIQLLLQKGLISAEEAANLRAEVAIQKQEEKEQRKDFPVEAGKAMKLSGYTQVRYRADPTINDTFDIRRARLDLKGAIGSGFDYRLQTDFAGSSAKVLDATVGWRFDDALKLTGGQFKIPFSQENLLSSPKLETVNRSQVVEALVARGKDVIGNHNGRDIGVMAGGKVGVFGKPGWLDYSVGVFNGSGINTSDTNDHKDVVGRVVVTPLTGLSLGASAYDGKYTLSLAPKKEGDRERLGLEIAYAKGPLVLKGEYIEGKDAAIKKDGWYALAGYFFVPKVLQAVLKYDTFDPNTAQSNDVTDISTIGINWFFNKWAFVQVNYEIKDETGPKISNDALTGQLTLQF